MIYGKQLGETTSSKGGFPDDFQILTYLVSFATTVASLL